MNIINLIMIALVFFSTTNLMAASPTNKNCDYYLDKEKETGCWFSANPQSDYLVKYGYKYCSIFRNQLVEWTDKREDWVKKTTECLQKEVQQVANPINCSRLEDHAWDSHPGCYRKAGFCALNASQKTSIVWTAIGADTLLSPARSFYQAFVLLGECLEGLPEETAAIQNRVMETVRQNPKLQQALIAAVDLERLSETEQKIYAKKALELLLTDSKKIGVRSIEAYTAVYGTKGRTAPALSEIKTECLTGKVNMSGFCKEAASAAGSKANFESLRKIPLHVSEETIRDLINFKKQLHLNK